MTAYFDNRSQKNAFVDHEFDRLGEKRKNDAWLNRTLQDTETRYIAVWRHRCAATSEQLRFVGADEFLAVDSGEPILLGRHGNTTVFAIDLGEEQQVPAAYSGWDFQNLRSIGTHLHDTEAALAAFALAMVLWIRRHRYCGHCGSPNVAGEAGHILDCSNSLCGERSFPRSDPAVIVLATDGERVLLGRQATWPPGRYSTIAGFVEPGESLEGAVRREVAEETGHRVSTVEYFSSQPWPFPASLMLGFTARVSATAVTEPDEELEDVRWFTTEEIKARTISGPPMLPPPMSIAYRLIERWFNKRSVEPLAQISAQSQ